MLIIYDNEDEKLDNVDTSKFEIIGNAVQKHWQHLKDISDNKKNNKRC